MERIDEVRRTSRLRALTTLAVLASICCASSLPAQLLEARGAGYELRLERTTLGEHRVLLSEDRQVTLPLSAVASVGDFRLSEGDWLVAAIDRRRPESSLVAFEGRGDKLATLPSPKLTGAKMVREPRLLVAAAGLDGLLWLEGDAGDRLEVRASRWQGGEWSEPVTVSPTGPGTQIALTATVLADGSWLAAWAAFDGRDDEILWSRLETRADEGGDSQWTPPRPVAANNAVPDITPALVATADGALLAWSRYVDRDYRVHLARFDDGAWSEPAKIGTRGSAFPTFRERRTPVLIYRQAEPDAWRVAELDARGKVLRQAEVPALDAEAPVVDEITDFGVVLAWAESSASARWQEQKLSSGEGSSD